MNSTQQEKVTPANTASKRRVALTRLTTAFVLIGLGAAAYWFMVLRHHENTDDAYTHGDIVPVMAQTTGTVQRIHADDTQMVSAGKIMVQLDPSDAQQTLDRAEAQLAETVRKTRQMMTGTQKLEAVVALRKVELNKAQGDYQRRVQAAQSGAVGPEEIQHAKDAMEGAKAALQASIQDLNANRELLLNDIVAKQPAVAQAASMVKTAWLNLHRTNVLAPVTGEVARRNVQLGQQIQPGLPLMGIVPLDKIWIEANFKESQLKDIRIGQPVSIVSDLYGDGVKYHGKVAGIAAGSGSVFSLLPPQNATGNWIKVVQRVPVRITLDPKELKAHPLRLGLSMNVTIDTSNQTGALLTQATNTPVLETKIYDNQLKQADQVVAKIIESNIGRH